MDEVAQAVCMQHRLISFGLFGRSDLKTSKLTSPRVFIDSLILCAQPGSLAFFPPSSPFLYSLTPHPHPSLPSRLNSNEFTGRIPNCIGNLKSLIKM